jgi:hypothetical protein
MQLLYVRQVLDEQVGEVGGVSEMFRQRATGGFPQSMDSMHVPGSSGEYVEDVFAKSEMRRNTSNPRLFEVELHEAEGCLLF